MRRGKVIFHLDIEYQYTLRRYEPPLQHRWQHARVGGHQRATDRRQIADR